MVPEKNDGWGWIAKASLVYKGEYGNVNFSYSRNVIAAYGLNGAAEQNALHSRLNIGLPEGFSILFSAGYYTLKSVIRQNFPHRLSTSKRTAWIRGSVTNSQKTYLLKHLMNI